MCSQNKKEEAFKAKNPSLCQHHSLHHQPGKEGLKTIEVSLFTGTQIKTKFFVTLEPQIPDLFSLRITKEMYLEVFRESQGLDVGE